MVADEFFAAGVTIDKSKGKDNVKFESFAHVNSHDGDSIRIGEGAAGFVGKGVKCLNGVVGVLKDEFGEFLEVAVSFEVLGFEEIAKGCVKVGSVAESVDGLCEEFFVLKVIVGIGLKRMSKEAFDGDFGRVKTGFEEGTHEGVAGGFGEGLCAF